MSTTSPALIEDYDSFAPTTIILDTIMPGVDANELVLWLAKRKCTAPIIIIAGCTPDYATYAKILAEFEGLGPVTTLHKPVEVSELRAVFASEESC